MASLQAASQLLVCPGVSIMSGTFPRKLSHIAALISEVLIHVFLLFLYMFVFFTL